LGSAPSLSELDQGHPAGRRSPLPARELDLAAALEDKLADEEPAALRDEDYAFQSWGARTLSARWIPSSCFVEGLSFAFTSGGIPTSLIDVPLRVRYCPTVRSSAPPLFSGITSWKVPLPNEVVPTTFATPD